MNGSEHPIPSHVPPHLVLTFDIFNDARLVPDVHVGYARLFSEAPPIFWTPLNGGHWVVMGHDALGELLTSPTLFSSRHLQIPLNENEPPFIPSALDPPDHAIYRKVISSYFMPASVNLLEDEMRGLAVELIAAVRLRGECEFIKDISEKMPISVFMRMMGMPLERFAEFRAMAVGIMTAHEPSVKIGYFHQVIAELDALVAARRVRPENDLISRILDARIEGLPLAEDRIRSLCLNLFLGGMDTVTNGMTFFARHLADNPDLQDRLRAEPSVIPEAVTEALRRYGFVNTVRRTTRDLTYRGVDMMAGEMIFCALPSVGVDPAANDNPAVFDVDRKRRTHFAFSFGAHTCAGLHLARLEMRVLFEEWHARIPRFRIAPDARLHAHSGVVMGLDALPLVWTSH